MSASLWPCAGLGGYRSGQSAGRRPGETLDGVGELPGTLDLEVDDQADLAGDETGITWGVLDHELEWTSHGLVVDVDVAGGRL